MLFLRQWLTNIFSLEFLIAFVVFAGNFKAIPFVHDMPIDLTLLLSILILLAFFWGFFASLQLPFSKNKCYALLFFTAFVTYYGLSILWSPAPIMGLQKEVMMLVRVAIPVYTIILLVSRAQLRVRRLLSCICLFSGIVLLGSLYYLLALPQQSVISTFGSSYQITGSAVAIFFVMSFCGLLYERTWYARVAYLLISTISFYALASIGNRAAFLAALSVCFILFLIQMIRNNHYKALFIFLLLILTIMLGSIYVDLYYPHFFDKLMPLTISRLGVLIGQYGVDDASRFSVQLRILYYKMTFREILPNHYLFGCGSGGWFALSKFTGMLTPGDIAVTYPHNVLLEVWSEAGLVGLFLLLAFYVTCIRNFFQQMPWTQYFDNKWLVIVALFANAFLQSMFSGSIATDFYTLIFLALLLSDVGQKTILNKEQLCNLST